MADTEKYSTNISFRSMPQSLKIIWKIPDYFSLPETPEDYPLESPSFIFANAKWCIRLYPNDPEGTSYALVRLNSLVSCHEIVFICNIYTETEEYYHSQYQKLTFEEDCEADDYICLPTRSELFKEQEELAVDGTLTLIWHLLPEKSKKENLFSQSVLHKMDSSEILCRDFKNLLLNGNDYDLTLKVRDKEFRVHRNILRARSQVFESMLTHDMMEKNSGVVDIPDCDPQAMEQFLLYVYCGKVDELNENNMQGLYYAADKYNMMNLKEKCHDFIKKSKSMSCSNICDIIQLALNHTDKSLLECATNFFLDNTTEVLTTANWLTFLKENEVAANELFIKASKKWTDTQENAKDSQKLNSE